MPTISIRGVEMPASPIRKLAPLADAAKQRGVHVFHLNIGQPDLPTPQVAIDAIRNIDRKVLEYSPSAGYRSYREKLVGYYQKYNINHKIHLFTNILQFLSCCCIKINLELIYKQYVL